jgi:acyl-CoA synthetase (AMP-forming)/AMP-acid ligase II
MPYDATQIHDWQIAEAAEAKMPTPDQWRGRLGLEPGDRVAVCMPMVPEILSILYGCFKAGMTVVPIFAGFGPGAIAARIEDSGARLLFTADCLMRRGRRLPLAEKMPDSVVGTSPPTTNFKSRLQQSQPARSRACRLSPIPLITQRNPRWTRTRSARLRPH